MMRTGIGFDAHAFQAGRPLILGGQEIAHDKGLAGHSDGDVVCHALGDALLGALALGDLGKHFPNNERWRGAASTEILAQCMLMVRSAGWRLISADVTVIAEKPPIAPHRDDILDQLEGFLGSPPHIWIKATTTDGLGFTGRGEGIAAMAVVLIERPAPD